MSAETMSNVDSNAPQQATRTRTNSGQEYESTAVPDVQGPLFRTEYPVAGVAPPFPIHSGGSCSSFYGAPRQVGYPDYSDRFSAGYQRMGQTITLTSHKIQFGCQSGQQREHYGRHRFGAPGYNPQYQFPSGKPWADTSIERPPSVNPPKPNNRGRTTYSDEQIAELESVFNSNPYPTSQTRQHLAFKIDVPEGKVKIWFQNRRARAKKSKLGCGGVGSWRPSHNDSRSSCEERTNQNNNNAKECIKVEPPPISINSILPLPTKTSINATKWPGSGVPHPWRHQYDGVCSRNSSQYRMHGHTDCSAVHGCYQCASNAGYNGNTRPWNWNPNAYNAQQCALAYRPNQTLEGSEATQQIRSESGRTSPWSYPGTFGSVPDLISQTSKEGMIGEVNLKVGDGIVVQNRGHEELNRCATAPVFNAPMSAALLCQEKRTSYFANELSSPPPIRRLIFPFHTLTETKITPSETSMGATATSGIPSAQNGTYSGFQSIASSQAMHASENYQPYTYVKPALFGNYQSGIELGTFTQMQRADNKWETSTVKLSNKIPEIRENEDAKCESNSGDGGCSPLAHVKDDDDDDDATDDALDEPGMNDCATAEEGRSSNKPDYSFSAADSEQFLPTCWSNRTTSNILVKAIEFAADDNIEERRNGDRDVGQIANLDSDIGQSVDATGIWSNQFVSGIYPPSSASMVG